MATNDNRYLVSVGNTTYSANTSGNLYYNTTANTMHISTGTHWQPVTTATTTFTTVPHTYTTYNGDPNDLLGSRIFDSVEKRIEHQQRAYEEPRDHEYSPEYVGEACVECYAHNLHRFSPDKHLFVIDEEIPWCDRLAS